MIFGNITTGNDVINCAVSKLKRKKCLQLKKRTNECLESWFQQIRVGLNKFFSF